LKGDIKMKREFYIYQCPMSVEYCFRGFKFAMKHGFTRKDYVHVYYGHIESETVNEALEKLFIKFNVERPADYYARSLSVSDLVCLDDKFYYCDSFGWSECPREN
jgi:hypothetical protein